MSGAIPTLSWLAVDASRAVPDKDAGQRPAVSSNATRRHELGIKASAVDLCG
jgi:hypothetical protein